MWGAAEAEAAAAEAEAAAERGSVASRCANRWVLPAAPEMSAAAACRAELQRDPA